MPRPVLTDRLEAGPSGRVILWSATPKGWRARKPATRNSAEIPGTAVQWEESLYEVLEAVVLPDGEVRYELAAWDGRHSARHVQTYDEPNERSRAAEERRDRRRGDRYALAVVLSPLLGHLPSELQQRIENETAFPAPRLTLISAIPLALFGILCLLSVLVEMVGGGAFLPSWLGIVGGYLLFESGTRISIAVAQARPIGSLAGEAAMALVRAIRRRASAAVSGGPAGSEQNRPDTGDR